MMIMIYFDNILIIMSIDIYIYIHIYIYILPIPWINNNIATHRFIPGGELQNSYY